MTTPGSRFDFHISLGNTASERLAQPAGGDLRYIKTERYEISAFSYQATSSRFALADYPFGCFGHAGSLGRHVYGWRGCVQMTAR